VKDIAKPFVKPRFAFMSENS